DYHLKVRKSGVYDLKNHSPFNKKRETKVVAPPGYKAEKTVYEAIKKYFLGRECLTYMHFPIHNHNFQGRREMDILVVDRLSGLSVIEVKGITIDQITSIQGGDWHVTNYFGRNKINPYRQAEMQLNSLCNYLEKHPLLYRRFTKRVVVALPYITRAEKERKNYHKFINMPPVLLKDDHESSQKIGEMESYYIYKAEKPLDDEQWDLLKSHFSIEGEKSLVHEDIYSS